MRTINTFADAFCELHFWHRIEVSNEHRIEIPNEHRIEVSNEHRIEIPNEHRIEVSNEHRIESQISTALNEPRSMWSEDAKLV